MTYTFACPSPCSHEIRVHAENGDNAVIKLTNAGALRCRNVKYRCHCEKAQHDISPLSEEKLKQIIRICTQEEPEKQEDFNGIPASSYGLLS
jgi:hypothetical protein